MNKREADKLEEKAKEAVKETGELQETSEKFFYLDDNGEVKSVYKDRKLDKITLTGNKTMDSERLTDYANSITVKINDIVQLNKLGQLSDGVAAEQILRLKKLQDAARLVVKSFKPKKVKTLKPKKVKKFKAKKISSIKLTSTPNRRIVRKKVSIRR